MSMKIDDRIVYKERGAAQTAIDYARTHGAKRMDEVEACIRETYRLAAQYNLDPCICVARQCDETGGDGGKVYCSEIWTERLNSGGLGVTDGGDEMMSFADGAASARAFVAHMVTYSTQEFSMGELTPADDPRYQATKDAGWNDTVVVLDDLEGKWYTNPQGSENTVARGNAVYPTIADQEGPPAGTYEVAGLGMISLSFPLEVDLVPASQTNQRPGIPMDPDRWIQHETGNTSPGADAYAEAGYLHSGADGQQLSYHFAVDDIRAVQLVPVDEVAWHGGDGDGPCNYQGIACELCVGSTVDWEKARLHAEELCAAVTAKAGIPVSMVFQHQTCYGKDCPHYIRAEGYWPTYLEHVETYREPVEPEPIYPTHRIEAPDRIEAQGHPLVINNPDRFLCTHGGRFKTAPSREAPDGTPTPYAANKTYTFGWRTDPPIDGEVWYVSKAGSWAMAKNFEPA